MIELRQEIRRVLQRGKVILLIAFDFADLEHYGTEAFEWRFIAGWVSSFGNSDDTSKQNKYVFVDEYQDINPVQKAILDMVCSKGNIFVVGDIKQSIYAFRGAEAEDFP